MTTEITKAENQLPADTGSGRGVEGVDRQDLILPHLLLCQSGMDDVTRGNFKLGEIRSSLTSELIDAKNPEGPIDFIPFASKKFWLISRYNDKRKEFDAMVPYGPENEDWEWGDFEEDDPDTGVVHSKFRTKVNRVYGMVGSELVDNPGALPTDVLFKSTSNREGKKLLTMMSAFSRKGDDAWNHAYRLSSKVVSDDKGTYAVWIVGGTTRPTTDTEKKAAEEWYNVFRQGSPVVDDVDTEES